MSAAGEAAGLFARLGSALYDALLLAAVLMMTTAALLPLTGGEALTPQTLGPFEYAYRTFLALIVILYFGLNWTRSGQTLGLRTWKIRVVRENGERLRWRDVLLRLAAASVSWLACGIGVLWMLVDRKKLTWQDRWSRTRVVKI